MLGGAIAAALLAVAVLSGSVLAVSPATGEYATTPAITEETDPVEYALWRTYLHSIDAYRMELSLIVESMQGTTVKTRLAEHVGVIIAITLNEIIRVDTTLLPACAPDLRPDYTAYLEATVLMYAAAQHRLIAFEVPVELDPFIARQASAWRVFAASLLEAERDCVVLTGLGEVDDV